MKLSKHLANLFLFSLFGFMIVVPFSLSAVSTNQNSVLGDQAVRNYFKKTVADAEDVSIRTIDRQSNTERDLVSVISKMGSSYNYYSLYELSNLTGKPIRLILKPQSQVLGGIEGKRVSLKISEQPEVVIYYDRNLNGQVASEVEVTLKPNETKDVGITIEGDNNDSLPITFDLLWEEASL